MIQTMTLSPGVTLRCFTDHRFKQARLTLQFVRPICHEEAAQNALLPTVLLRGSAKHPDLRSINMHLDTLYGAVVSDMVRRFGDYQTFGLYCVFTGERFAMAGDEILRPVTEFLQELLLQPLLEDGVFSADVVESEKKNRIADIESELNDKRIYASTQLIRTMCAHDSLGIPRLGTKEQVAAITPETLYRHYQKILQESPVEFFYVGATPPEQVARLLQPIFAGFSRQVVPVPPPIGFHDGGGCRTTQELATSQSHLLLGFTTPIVGGDADYVAMRVANLIFGAGMTSKLFVNVREKMSLCYSIHSDYYGAKGILVVSAGIDADREETVHQQILTQLQACANGDITEDELRYAKEALLSSLRSIHDSTRSIAGYYTLPDLSPGFLPPEQYRAAVEAVTTQDVARAASTLREHSAFFLKGVGQ